MSQWVVARTNEEQSFGFSQEKTLEDVRLTVKNMDNSLAWVQLLTEPYFGSRSLCCMLLPFSQRRNWCDFCLPFSQLQGALKSREREINSLRRQLDSSQEELPALKRDKEVLLRENRRLQDDLATMTRENQVDGDFKPCFCILLLQSRTQTKEMSLCPGCTFRNGGGVAREGRVEFQGPVVYFWSVQNRETDGHKGKVHALVSVALACSTSFCHLWKWFLLFNWWFPGTGEQGLTGALQDGPLWDAGMGAETAPGRRPQ